MSFNNRRNQNNQQQPSKSCAGCQQWMPKTNFSSNQWGKPSGSKCTQCIGQQQQQWGQQQQQQQQQSFAAAAPAPAPRFGGKPCFQGVKCSRASCPYNHPPGWKFAVAAPAAAAAFATPASGTGTGFGTATAFGIGSPAPPFAGFGQPAAPANPLPFTGFGNPVAPTPAPASAPPPFAGFGHPVVPAPAPAPAPPPFAGFGHPVVPAPVPAPAPPPFAGFGHPVGPAAPAPINISDLNGSWKVSGLGSNYGPFEYAAVFTIGADGSTFSRTATWPDGSAMQPVMTSQGQITKDPQDGSLSALFSDYSGPVLLNYSTATIKRTSAVGGWEMSGKWQRADQSDAGTFTASKAPAPAPLPVPAPGFPAPAFTFTSTRV
jgi:hypothetical protein